MIGFPLQLPIDNMTPREIVLVETNHTVSAPDLPTMMHDHFFQVRIFVTPQEATALRVWMESRNSAEIKT